MNSADFRGDYNQKFSDFQGISGLKPYYNSSLTYDTFLLSPRLIVYMHSFMTSCPWLSSTLLNSTFAPPDWGVQLILAYSWARPAILVVGKGRGGMFLFLLFLHFHSCSSFFPVPLFHLLYSLFYLFSLFLWETTQNDPQGLTCR